MLVGNNIPLYLIEFLAAVLNERNELSPKHVSACIVTNELEKRDEDASRHMPLVLKNGVLGSSFVSLRRQLRMVR
jgi:hypothetical protein